MAGYPEWDSGLAGLEVADSNRNPWDTLVLGGVALPGRAHVRAHRGRKHDRKGAPGCDGETFTDLGSRVAELEIVITVWSAKQLEALTEALDKALPAPKKVTKSEPKVTPQGLADQARFWLGGQGTLPLPAKPQPTKGESLEPITIAHPSLARLRVRSILITEEENFQPGHEPGTFEWRCRAVEFMGKGTSTVVGTADGSISLREKVASGIPVQSAPTPPSESDGSP